MNARNSLGLALILGLTLSACDQPFEPDGPASNKLVLYSVLNASSKTQYVRVSTTYPAAPGTAVRNATVQMVRNEKTIAFHDTTVMTTDANGQLTPINVYVAYNEPITSGTTYALSASTPAGLTATASATALSPPSFSMYNPSILSDSSYSTVRLNTSFNSISGAYVMHFYVDYYALIDGGWEMRRVEIPSRTYLDAQGATVQVYPSLELVQSLTQTTKAVPIQFEERLYTEARAEINARYAAAPVVWLRAVFVLTQIDNVLFNYYYVNNGPVDNSSVRLDRPDYTNISGGLGVFGSSVTVTMTYAITK
jgi:hypothetical protein